MQFLCSFYIWYFKVDYISCYYHVMNFVKGMTPEATFTKLNPYFLEGITNCFEIHRQSGIPVRTIGRYFKMFKKGVPLCQLRPRGRPLTFPKNFNNKIAKQTRKTPSASSRMIANSLKKSTDVNISRRTVNRRLNLMGYKRMKPIPALRLNQSHINKRILFYKNNKKTNWKNVIFSDESTFELDQCRGEVWAKNRSEAIRTKDRHPSKVMVWGAFSFKGKSKLLFVNGMLNGQGYVKLLKSHLIPFARRCHDKNYIFQQDNAPCHTCRVSSDFLNSKRINVLTWPPCSPDLNPIENVWGIMKSNLLLRNPSTLDELKQFIQEEWDAIPLSTLRKMALSMESRLHKLKIAKGKQIRY